MVTFDGGIWALPYINSATFLYYNKDMFNRLGLSPPNTFSELEHVANTLIANGIVPFAEANLTRWPGAQHFVFLSMRLGGADIFQRAMSGEVRFDHPAFIQAGEMLQDMVRNGWFPEGHNGMNWDTGESRMMMYSEQAGMIVQTSGFIASAFNENPDWFPNLGIHEYPAIEGGVGLQTDMLSGLNAFSVSTYAENPAVATALIKHVSTSVKTQQGLADGNTIAALRGMTYNSEQLQTGVGILAGATFMQNFIDQTMTPRLTDSHLGTAQALHGLTITPQEAAAQMQATFDADDGSFD
jgi:raffinose/stachyose/melibiose transport system substrate-binding protein